jgi:dolichyl-phosphate-mannose--protein O-mannosyl transferase
MTEYQTQPSRAPASGWAIGGIAFAGVMMMLIGIFEIIAGLAAIFQDEFFVVTKNYAFDVDVTAWGWIHFLLGAVIALAGYGVLKGATWGRVVGIVMAVLVAVANFFYIPYYPFWSILIIALAVWVIWALTRPLEA